MNQLMGNNTGHPLLVVGGRLVLIIQQVGLPVGNEAPVLHGTSTKVRNGYLIWIKTTHEPNEVSTCHFNHVLMYNCLIQSCDTVRLSLTKLDYASFISK